MNERYKEHENDAYKRTWRECRICLHQANISNCCYSETTQNRSLGLHIFALHRQLMSLLPHFVKHRALRIPIPGSRSDMWPMWDVPVENRRLSMISPARSDQRMTENTVLKGMGSLYPRTNISQHIQVCQSHIGLHPGLVSFAVRIQPNQQSFINHHCRTKKVAW